MKKKVLVGMSGGIDSSITALLLWEQGYDVEGLTLKLYNECDNSCCSDVAIQDAKKLCQKLGINHYNSDYQEDFHKFVVSDFINTYLSGKTPNPCVECNRHIKFKFLLKEADKKGVKNIATGHYCNIEWRDGSRVLVKGDDEAKDQSYFLYSLKEEWLSRIIFPLGKFKKSQVKEKAVLKGFDKLREKKESYEICFIPDSYKKFIHDRIGEIPGNIVFWPDNKILGNHNGIYNYTIGQSRGLNISYSHKLYVREIDSVSATVYVSEEKDVFFSEFKIENINFFSYFKKIYSKDEYYDVKIRYYSKPVKAKIKNIDWENKTAQVILENKVKAVTCGQSAVFYKDNVLLLGGKISHVSV